MSQHAAARWLVTYDISKPRNWSRVFKLLKKEGVPIQYSVFLVTSSDVKIAALVMQLAKLIDPKTDDVRIYKIPENAWSLTMGTAIIPDYLWLDAEGEI